MVLNVESESLGVIPVSNMLPGEFAVVTSGPSNSVGHVGNIVYKTDNACVTKLIDLTNDTGWSSGFLPKLMVRVLEPGTLLKVN